MAEQLAAGAKCPGVAQAELDELYVAWSAHTADVVDLERADATRRVTVVEAEKPGLPWWAWMGLGLAAGAVTATIVILSVVLPDQTTVTHQGAPGDAWVLR